MSNYAPPPISQYVVDTGLGGNIGVGDANTGFPHRGKVIIAVLLVCVLIMIYVSLRDKMEDTGCLSEAVAANGWILYTRAGCRWCDKQLHTLGGSYPKRVECPGMLGTDPKLHVDPVCGTAAGFPYWRNTNTKYDRSGYQDFASLVLMAAEPR